MRWDLNGISNGILGFENQMIQRVETYGNSAGQKMEAHACCRKYGLLHLA